MRILYIDHYAGSPLHGMEYRPHYLARHWVRMGHDVTVVAASVSHIRYKAPVMTADVTEEEIDGVRYIWLKTPHYAGNGMRRAFNMAWFVLRLFQIRHRFLHPLPPSVVIASSTYTWDIFPAHAIARAAAAKLVYEVHDLWPLSPMELGGMSRWHPFILSLQHGENYACRHADLVISMLPLAHVHLREHGMAPEKFHYIPNGIELSEWREKQENLPLPHRIQLAAWRQQDRFIICYAGSHGISDALDTLLDTAELMADQPVGFVLVGQGPEKERLRQRAERKNLSNICFLDPVRKEMIPDLLRRVDALFICWKGHPLYRFGISPNKLMDYMAAGKPIINAGNTTNDLVRDAGCGFSVRAEEASAVASVVERLMKLPASERERMGAAGKAYVRKHHDYAVLARQFSELMTEPDVALNVASG
jgi:glycosyltransferase involved in cell wall biosynthesis